LLADRVDRSSRSERAIAPQKRSLSWPASTYAHKSLDFAGGADDLQLSLDLSNRLPRSVQHMMKFGIGQSPPRFEDARLLRGEGRFLNDRTLQNQAYAVFLRSPHARARILGIDIRGTTALPGVLAVLTGEDVASDRLGTIPMTLRRKRPDGSPMFAPPHP